ncbi:MAG: orotate phosphoribosyltransferase [Oscillospiraceae bacterium]|nr:orotate phosphoribosyltransferase [Oscillospiraceae bacterium]
MNKRMEFIDFMIKSGALLFGEFKLKSGRTAPYFVNTGNYSSGGKTSKLGEFYADCLISNHIQFETLFGPAYKGIPLCVSCAAALYGKHHIDVGYCFDRKEIKDHGEGGVIVGKKLSDGEKVVIIEDVITAGTAIRQVLPVLKAAADVNITGMVISVDRMEVGTENVTAVKQVKEEFGIDVYSIVNAKDIIEYLENIPEGFAAVENAAEYALKMREYLVRYGG